MGRQEDRLADNPPDFEFYLRNDQDLQADKATPNDVIKNAYRKIEIYVQRFETIRINYEIDSQTHSTVITTERDLEKLRSLCNRYHHNMHALEGILPSVNVGLLKLKQNNFKEAVTPVCQSLLNILGNYLPRLAVEEVEKILFNTGELMGQIKYVPNTTNELVTYIRWLNDVGSEIDVLLADVDYAHDVFILIKDFNIFINDDEKEKYMGENDFIYVFYIITLKITQ